MLKPPLRTLIITVEKMLLKSIQCGVAKVGDGAGTSRGHSCLGERIERKNQCVQQRAICFRGAVFFSLGDSCFEIVDHVEHLHLFEPLISLCASILDFYLRQGFPWQLFFFFFSLFFF